MILYLTGPYETENSSFYPNLFQWWDWPCLPSVWLFAAPESLFCRPASAPGPPTPFCISTERNSLTPSCPSSTRDSPSPQPPPGASDKWFSLIFFNLHCSTFFSLVTILRQIALLVNNRWWFIRAKLRLTVHIDEINSTTRLRIISLLAWQSLGV